MSSPFSATPTVPIKVLPIIFHPSSPLSSHVLAPFYYPLFLALYDLLSFPMILCLILFLILYSHELPYPSRRFNPSSQLHMISLTPSESPISVPPHPH